MTDLPLPDFPSLDKITARTWAEIDLRAVRHNCKAAQTCLRGSAPGILAVVKADGYGLGMIPVARAIVDLVRAFAVANATEAEALRAAGIDRPVYLLGPALPAEWEGIARHGFCPALSTLEEVSGLGAAAQRTGRSLAVHVVVDTGMGRIGVLPEGAATVIAAVLAHPFLTLDSVASHFPLADGDEAFTRAQAGQFSRLIADLRAAGLTIPHTQLVNSAGLTGGFAPEPDWARAGLMLYGVSPRPEEQSLLRRVVTWKTRVTLVRDLPAGHGVSYGRTFITEKPTRVASLAVGYADGYPRQASGRGAQVLLSGQRCPVLGRVTMDQLMVDASALPAAPVPGDEAVLTGPQGSQEITAAELAAWGQTIAWDLFTGLGPRVQRHYC